MATEKQVAANRANSGRSCGPRSVSGKRRASRNALRHGLSRQDTSTVSVAEREKLAHRLAGACQDAHVLEFARMAAEADLELARVRRVKSSLIARACALGGLVPPRHFSSLMLEIRWCQAMYLWVTGVRPIKPPDALSIDPLASMPAQEPDRTAEAVRRVISELLQLNRYEGRAASRRERAICQMLEAKTNSGQTSEH
jgi:hypothetical protein